MRSAAETRARRAPPARRSTRVTLRRARTARARAASESKSVSGTWSLASPEQRVELVELRGAVRRRPPRRARRPSDRRSSRPRSCPPFAARRSRPEAARRGAWRRSAARRPSPPEGLVTVASPSRSASSRLIRIGSPSTRKRSAIRSISGAGSGCGIAVVVALAAIDWHHNTTTALCASVLVNGHDGDSTTLERNAQA